MPFLAEISGENETLSLAEAVAICHPVVPEVRRLDGRIHLFSGGNAARVHSRAAMVHWAGEVVAESDTLDGLPRVTLDGGTFRVDVKGSIDNRLSAIGKVVSRIDGGTVGLKGFRVRFILHRGDRFRLAKVIRAPPKGFDERKPQNRPFFSPISMLPRQARLLLNLARIPDGGSVLDPLCGTGGIALEAASMGYRVMVSDIDSAMVNGTLENMASFGFAPERAEVCGVADAPERFPRVDCVVADPPYGRSSSTKGAGVISVVRDMFAAATRVLGDGGTLAVALPDPALVALGEEYLNLLETHPYRIHGSLVRHFCVFTH